MANLDSIKLKVEKLLAMAADREGSPEGDAFRVKAFELMAQYGVDEAQLSAGEEARVVHRETQLTGTYTDMQFMLLNALGTVLHCQVVMFKLPRSSKVSKAVLFGRPHHVERAVLLYGFLSPAMIAGATTMTDMWPDENISLTTRKRSWMTGFVSEITARLRSIEAEHTPEYAQAGNGVQRSGEVVLQQDRDLAAELALEHFPHLRRSRGSRRRIDPLSFEHGAQEGKNMDLGQTRMSNARGALPQGAGGRATG